MAKGRIKTGEKRVFEKLLMLMISGEPVTKEQMKKKLGKEIVMYRISSYMLNIKMFANGSIKTHKDGRKVLSYQLLNTDEVKQYLAKRGFIKEDQIQKIEDLKAEPIVETEKQPVNHE